VQVETHVCIHKIRHPSPWVFDSTPCVLLLCELISCYALERAWFQRLKVKCDEPLSSFAFKINLCRYTKAGKHRRIDIVLVPHSQLYFAMVRRCRLTLSIPL